MELDLISMKTAVRGGGFEPTASRRHKRRLIAKSSKHNARDEELAVCPKEQPCESACVLLLVLRCCCWFTPAPAGLARDVRYQRHAWARKSGHILRALNLWSPLHRIHPCQSKPQQCLQRMSVSGIVSLPPSLSTWGTCLICRDQTKFYAPREAQKKISAAHTHL